MILMIGVMRVLDLKLDEKHFCSKPRYVGYRKNLPGFRSWLSVRFRRCVFRNSGFGVRGFQFGVLLAKRMEGTFGKKVECSLGEKDGRFSW